MKEFVDSLCEKYTPQIAKNLGKNWEKTAFPGRYRIHLNKNLFLEICRVHPGTEQFLFILKTEGGSPLYVPKAIKIEKTTLAKKLASVEEEFRKILISLQVSKNALLNAEEK